MAKKEFDLDAFLAEEPVEGEDFGITRAQMLGADGKPRVGFVLDGRADFTPESLAETIREQEARVIKTVEPARKIGSGKIKMSVTRNRLKNKLADAILMHDGIAVRGKKGKEAVKEDTVERNGAVAEAPSAPGAN